MRNSVVEYINNVPRVDERNRRNDLVFSSIDDSSHINEKKRTIFSDLRARSDEGPRGVTRAAMRDQEESHEQR